MINANIAALLYLVAGVLFILALRGLSSPASSRRGNLYGMVGMTIAILTTLAVSGVRDPLSWGLIVLLGTYSEFLLPLLIVLGLFTRLSALGMIGFIAVQTLVDITVHKVDAATIGALFDRFPDSVILDQRLLWIFPLVYLVLNGGGRISLDGLLASRRTAAMPT